MHVAALVSALSLQQNHFLGKILALQQKISIFLFVSLTFFTIKNIYVLVRKSHEMFLLNSDSVSSYEQVNDTVGALSLGYYHDPDTVVAVVFGTGSNACYLERIDAIIKCQGLLTTSGSMVLRIISWPIFRSQL